MSQIPRGFERVGQTFGQSTAHKEASAYGPELAAALAAVGLKQAPPPPEASIEQLRRLMAANDLTIADLRQAVAMLLARRKRNQVNYEGGKKLTDTTPRTKGSDDVTAAKIIALKALLGDDLAEELIAQAEKRSKAKAKQAGQAQATTYKQT